MATLTVSPAPVLPTLSSIRQVWLTTINITMVVLAFILAIGGTFMVAQSLLPADRAIVAVLARAIPTMESGMEILGLWTVAFATITCALTAITDRGHKQYTYTYIAGALFIILSLSCAYVVFQPTYSTLLTFIV